MFLTVNGILMRETEWRATTLGNISHCVCTELPDQLGMIIPFSKEIIGPAGVFVHVFTCTDCFKAGAEWCGLEATDAANRVQKVGGCDNKTEK